MDANQTWIDLSQAVADEKWLRAAEIAEDLFEWLARGGFLPKITVPFGQTLFLVFLVGQKNQNQRLTLCRAYAALMD